MNELTGLTYVLHDSVMFLAPAGWGEVQLKFGQVAGRLRLLELSTRGEGSTEPLPKPDFHVDPKAEALRLADCVIELTHLLDGQGKPWAGDTLELSRKETHTDVRLIKPDGSPLWFTRLLKDERDLLLCTPALFDAVWGTQRAFETLQGRLEERLGAVAGFSFDEAAGQLTLERASGPSATVRVQVLGQYLTDDFTWVWSWSDPDSNPATVKDVRRICTPEAQPTGFSALWRGHFHCDEGFAWALAGYVMVSLGARGLFRAEVPGQGSAVFFALLEDP
jgi:hypothetical protein